MTVTPPREVSATTSLSTRVATSIGSARPSASTPGRGISTGIVRFTGMTSSSGTSCPRMVSPSIVVAEVTTPLQSIAATARTAPTPTMAPRPGASRRDTPETSASAAALPSGPAEAVASATVAVPRGASGGSSRMSLSVTTSSMLKAVAAGRPSSGSTSNPSRSRSVDRPRASASAAVLAVCALAGGERRAKVRMLQSSRETRRNMTHSRSLGTAPTSSTGVRSFL